MLLTMFLTVTETENAGRGVCTDLGFWRFILLLLARLAGVYWMKPAAVAEGNLMPCECLGPPPGARGRQARTCMRCLGVIMKTRTVSRPESERLDVHIDFRRCCVQATNGLISQCSDNAVNVAHKPQPLRLELR